MNLLNYGGTRQPLSFGTPRPGDVAHSQADNATLRRLFPDIAPATLNEGLAKTLNWFKENA